MIGLILFGALAATAQSDPVGSVLDRAGDLLRSRPATSAVSDCPTNGQSLRGSRTPLTCGCPAVARVEYEEDLIRGWGDGVYTDDSNICYVAIHDGRITTSGGRVTVWAAPGQARYGRATRNGIATLDYQDFPGSIRFTPPGTSAREATPVNIPAKSWRAGPVGEDVPVATRVSASVSDCPVDGNPLRGSIAPLTCGCPAVDPRLPANTVWGNRVYTADSSICTAALHDGRITRSGGRVTVWPAPGRAYYGRATRNGIASIDYRDFPASFRFTPPPTRRR